jgi:hypothetical protein
MQATRPRHCLQNAAATTTNTTRTCSGLPTYTVLQQLKTQQMSHQNNDHQCALTGFMSNARYLPETETNRLEEKANYSKDMDVDTQLLKQFTYPYISETSQEDVEAPPAATTIMNNTRTCSAELPILQQLKARHMSPQNNDYQHCDLTGFVSNTRSIPETNRHEESVENFWDLTHPYTVNKEHDDHDDWPLAQHDNNLKDMEMQLTDMEIEFLTRSRILAMM